MTSGFLCIVEGSGTTAVFDGLFNNLSQRLSDPLDHIESIF